MIKVLVDENLSEYFAEGLNQLQMPLASGIEVTSIAKEFQKGIKDEEWIPQWGKNPVYLSHRMLKSAPPNSNLHYSKNIIWVCFF